MNIRYFGLLTCVYMGVLSANLSDHEQYLVSHLQNCINLGNQERSKLTPAILAMDGMSSAKNRHFLNNLCSMPGTNYLEVGVWKGSTFVSALFGNASNVLGAVAIDNWSEFSGPKADFLNNCKFIGDITHAFYEEDCFKINKEKISKAPINIYFYDGEHTAEAQEQAFTYFNDVLDSVFIAVVDDWNHQPVEIGTRAAFNKLGYTVLFEQVMPARFNGDKELWWNGLYVAVLRK